MTVRVDGFIMWNLTTTTGLYFERKKGISVLVVYIWRFFVVSSQRFEILTLKYLFHTFKLQARTSLNSFLEILYSDVFEVICVHLFPCLTWQALQPWPPLGPMASFSWRMRSLRWAALGDRSVPSIKTATCVTCKPCTFRVSSFSHRHWFPCLTTPCLSQFSVLFSSVSSPCATLIHIFLPLMILFLPARTSYPLFSLRWDPKYHLGKT